MERAGPPGPPDARQEGSLEGRMLRALLAHTEEHGYVRGPRRPLPARLGVARQVARLDHPDALHRQRPCRIACASRRRRRARRATATWSGPRHRERPRDPSAPARTRSSPPSATWPPPTSTSKSVMGLLCERTMELTGADGATVALLERRRAAHRCVPRLARTPGSARCSASTGAWAGSRAAATGARWSPDDALDDPRVNPERVAPPASARSSPCPCCHSRQAGRHAAGPVPSSAERLRRRGRETRSSCCRS